MIGYRKFSLVMGMIVLFAASCTFDELPYNANELPEVVSFSENMVPYFETSCAISGCHSAGAVPPDLSADNAYASLSFGGYLDLDNPDQSLIYTVVAAGGFMSQYATDYDRDLTLKWIEEGAENN